jgi:cytochrome c oxidase subunit 3
MGLLRQKEVVYFSLLIRKVIALADFAVNLHEEREQLTQIRQSGLWEGSLPNSVAEVQAGFKSHPDILIRTEVLTAEKQNNTFKKRI